jgi:hypothetical protein
MKVLGFSNFDGPQAMAVALVMHGSRKGDLLAQHFRIEPEELDFSI